MALHEIREYKPNSKTQKLIDIILVQDKEIVYSILEILIHADIL